jgi:hypothetical protein
MGTGYAALLLAAALGVQGAPVAFVADVRGAATLEDGEKLTFLTELTPGMRLMLGSHATAAITFAATGAEYALAGPGQFVVAATEVTAERGTQPKRRIVAALSDPAVVGQAARTATASLRMRSVPPSSPPPAALEFPVATRVATLRPAMRWRADPGEESTVVVVDPSGREVWKGRGKSGTVRPGIPLAADTRYTWSVSTARGGLGEAQFETLGAAAIQRAERARAAAKASFSDRVVSALLLQEIGAQQEAREAWAALARERPDLAELPALSR